MPDVAADSDCVGDADKLFDETESDAPGRTNAVEFPPDFSKLPLALIDVLIPPSEPSVFDSVEDDEGLEVRVTETDDTAELVLGRWVKDCVDVSSLDVTTPFSRISSSPVLFDAIEGIEFDRPEVEFEAVRREMVDDGFFSKASSSPLMLWDVDEGIEFDVPEVDCEVISCEIVDDGLLSRASSSSLVLLDADGEIGVDVPEVEFEAINCEMVDDGFFRKASSTSPVL